MNGLTSNKNDYCCNAMGYKLYLISELCRLAAIVDVVAE